MKNEILEELRQTRERLLNESGGTLQGLVARLQAEEKKSDRPIFIPEKLAAMDVSDNAAANRTIEENAH